MIEVVALIMHYQNITKTKPLVCIVQDMSLQKLAFAAR